MMKTTPLRGSRPSPRKNQLTMLLEGILKPYGVDIMAMNPRDLGDGSARRVVMHLNYTGRRLPETADLAAIESAGGLEAILRRGLEAEGLTCLGTGPVTSSSRIYAVYVDLTHADAQTLSKPIDKSAV